MDVYLAFPARHRIQVQRQVWNISAESEAKPYFVIFWNIAPFAVETYTDLLGQKKSLEEDTQLRSLRSQRSREALRSSYFSCKLRQVNMGTASVPVLTATIALLFAQVSLSHQSATLPSCLWRPALVCFSSRVSRKDLWIVNQSLRRVAHFMGGGWQFS